MTKIKVENFPSIRVSEKLREETEKCCEIVQENLSEYIREAAKIRNSIVKEGK